MLDQRGLLAHIDSTCKVKMNPELFARSDEDIIEALKKVILSCERNSRYFKIQICNFTVVDDYDEVNRILYDYYEDMSKSKAKSKRKDNAYGFININESDIRLLLVDYFVEVYTKPPKTSFPNAKPIPTEEHFRVVIMVPRIVNKYYFRINGITRSTLYQIVDGSTYNNSGTSSRIPNISFKIVFMALRVFRYFLDVPTHNGEIVHLSHYMCNCFNKTVSATKYILAKFGFYGAMEFMGFNGISITTEPNKDPDYYSFQKTENIYVNAPRYLVDNDITMQSFVATIYHSLVPGMDLNMAYDEFFWLRSIGGDFNGATANKMLQILDPDDITVTDTYGKGCSILDSFENIYDISTRESIRLPEEQKATMYHILRWIIREFNGLRKKDNLDLAVKKIRFSDHIASIYAMKVAKGIYRVADMNNKITTSTIRRAIRTDPAFLLTSISRSGLAPYCNIVSDMDSILALKFTYKGVAGLGEKDGDRSIPDIIRHIHPSHMGRVDLDSSSDGNPGITGTLSPFIQMDNNYFSTYDEPNTWDEKYAEVYDLYKKTTGLTEAITFREALLGESNEEQKEVVSEVAMAMKQIINPWVTANSGELYSPDEVDDELDLLSLLT